MKEGGREREEVQDIPLHTGLTADFQLLITLLIVRGGFSKKIFILGCRGSDCFGGFHSFVIIAWFLEHTQSVPFWW